MISASLAASLRALDSGPDLPPIARDRTSLLVVVTDAAGLARHACVVADLALDPPQPARVAVLGPLARRLARLPDASGVVLSVRRTGPAELLGGDDGWRAAMTGASGVAGLDLLGTRVVTPEGTAVLDGEGQPANQAVRRMARIAPRRTDGSSRCT